MNKKKDLTIFTMEEWFVKLTDLAEMDKLTSSIREKTSIFIGDWKQLWCKNEKISIRF